MYDKASVLNLLAKLELIDIHVSEFCRYYRGLFRHDPYRLLIITIDDNVLFWIKSDGFKDPNYILNLPTNVRESQELCLRSRLNNCLLSSYLPYYRPIK